MRQSVLTIVTVIAFVASASGGEVGTALVVRAAVDQTGPTAPSDVDRMLQAERDAEVELAVGAVRLGLLKARVRVAQGRHADAVAVARRAMEAAKRLPPAVDTDKLIEPLRAVIADARARRAGHRPRPAMSLTTIPAQAGGSTTHASTAPQAATQPRQQATPAAPPVGVPDGKRLSPADAAALDAARYALDADVQRGYKSDEADALLRVAEARRIPHGTLIYPDDWAEMTKRRAAYADGIIYAGPEFQDENGELKQTVIYDIGTLIVPIPDFTDVPEMNLETLTRDGADRAALRRASEIFTGYARELAAGIPLLNYFGGVNETRARPRIDEAARDELMRLVQEVIESR
ncbi:MAG: hypothetical protein ACE5E6_11415 [Phycisphaerae bacterium]